MDGCKMTKDIYSLNLGEVAVAEDGFLFTTVLRVPGGWLYRSYDKGNGIGGVCFVPYDNEFQQKQSIIPTPK